MADSAAAREVARGTGINGSGAEPGADPTDSFAQLRSLIVGPEQRELLALQAHLFDPSVQVRDVSRVLPDAIAMRATDPQLTRALAPSIEAALTSSIRRDPRPLADALFPVMGPAIRRAITHTLASMMESLNRTVEHSLSWRALQWRWTAFRTGKSFAEIVLLNTLEYRVEQVFLIHTESGLLLQHLSSDPRAGQDADQVSAMLTAIRDFVRDSFKTGGGDSLDALRVGDLAITVEAGPHATVAGVVRGVPPYALRTLFQDALESIHRQFGPELQAFQGDSAPFERTRTILETCLVTQFRPRQRAISYRRWLAVAVVVLIAIGVWTFLSVREEQRWNAYLERLRAEPGIVVLSSGRLGSKFFVGGLRDPLARDPLSLVDSTRVSAAAIESRWEPYQALYPAFVAARARDLLRPPPGVTLEYRDGQLRADGPAPGAWIADSERIAPAIAGVRRFLYAGTPPEVRLKERLEAISVLFPKGQSRLGSGQDNPLRALEGILDELNETLSARRRRAQIDVIGHTDADGSEELNGPLSQARADTVLRLLGSPLRPALDFTARGVGTVGPVDPGASDLAKENNRCVSFSVRLADDPAGGSDRR
jgi:outer membrane protein OmpA-like peptidoglycan-associated protein